MSKYFKELETGEGQVHILTKTRWLGLFPVPHTSIMPYHVADLTRLGTFIKWTTNDPTVLATLHEAVIRLVEQVGISGMVDIANAVKMAERAAMMFGGSWHGIIKEGARDNGVNFEVSDDILKYVKGFK
jgi:hypothetical protein